jgi:hypothetical protein
LDLAVALLRDPAGKIDLDFPGTGELDNPEFSYSGAIGKAFSNIILSLATSPFRLLGGLVGLKPEELESVAFRPGRSDLTPPQRETLNRLAEALVLRPQLRLEIPAVYDPQADRMMLQTLTTDTQIDQLLEQSAGEADAAPLTERRQTIIESLYDQAQASGDIIATRQEIRSANSQPDATGAVALDSLAYVEAMREALIAATSVSDSDMQTLAADRVRSIITSLRATDSLDASRFARIDAIESAMNDDGQIVMPLTLATTDSPNVDGPADSDPESGDPE